MRWFWLFLVAAAGLLFFSNPGMQEFKAFVAEESGRLVQERVTSPGLGEVLSDGAAQLAENYVQNVTVHKDYYLFSTYKINLTPRAVSKRNWRFLGIGGTFIDLTKFYDEK